LGVDPGATTPSGKSDSIQTLTGRKMAYSEAAINFGSQRIARDIHKNFFQQILDPIDLPLADDRWLYTDFHLSQSDENDDNLNAVSSLGFGWPLHLQAKTNILANGHGRKERIVLDPYSPGAGKVESGPPLPIVLDLSLGRILKTGFHAQLRRLPTICWPEQ
jgi:hypothetical protein